MMKLLLLLCVTINANSKGIEARDSVLSFTDKATGYKYMIRDELKIVDVHVASNQSASKWDPHEKRPTASLANEMDEDVETQSKTERIFGPFGQAINLQCSGIGLDTSKVNAVFLNPEGLVIPVGTNDRNYLLAKDRMLTIKKLTLRTSGIYKCRPEVVFHLEAQRFSSKIFDVQPLDCRHVGCDGPHCDCVIPPRKSQKLAECKCSYSSKSSLIKVPEDISWKLPNVKKCILITLVFFLMNLPVYIDWYLRNHKNLRKRRKGMKKKVTVRWKPTSSRPTKKKKKHKRHKKSPDENTGLLSDEKFQTGDASSFADTKV